MEYKTRIDRTTTPPTLIVTLEAAIRLTPLTTINEAKQRAHDVGSHYFDANTTKFFKARFHSSTSLPDGSILIVESTKRTGFDVADGPREYRVMRVMIDGKIQHYYTDNPGEKRTFSSVGKASTSMRKLAVEIEEGSCKYRRDS